MVRKHQRVIHHKREEGESADEEEEGEGEEERRGGGEKGRRREGEEERRGGGEKGRKRGGEWHTRALLVPFTHIKRYEASLMHLTRQLPYGGTESSGRGSRVSEDGIRGSIRCE